MGQSPECGALGGAGRGTAGRAAGRAAGRPAAREAGRPGVQAMGDRGAGAGRDAGNPAARDFPGVFGALVAEPLFLLADSAIVGRLGTGPLGSLGVAAQALTALVNVSIFLAYGTTAAVARQLGAGNRQAAIRHGIDGLWLAGAIGAVVFAVGVPLAAPIIGIFGATPAVAAAWGYLPADQPDRRSVHAGRAGRDRRAARPAGHPYAARRGRRWQCRQHHPERDVRARPALGHRRVGLGHGDRAESDGRCISRHGGPRRQGGRRQARPRPDRAETSPREHGGALVLRTVALQAVLVAATAIAAPGRRRGHRRAPDRVPAVDAACLRARRDRDRRAGHHRQVPRCG